MENWPTTGPFHGVSGSQYQVEDSENKKQFDKKQWPNGQFMMYGATGKKKWTYVNMLVYIMQITLLGTNISHLGKRKIIFKRNVDWIC